jgi:predicted deacylase
MLRGTLIGVPIANPLGFRRSSRYLPDRRDLNRYFPGRSSGSLASRAAFALFDQVVKRCDALVDFHSGSFNRTNLPQMRADLRDPRLLQLATWFGAPVVLHSEGREGTLRREAHQLGVRAVLFEAGEPTRFDPDAVEAGQRGTERVLRALGMLEGDPLVASETMVFRGSRWVRANEGGIFLGSHELGDSVETGDALGTVVDPFTHQRDVVRSPVRGRIIGRALDQVVLPGFALFHLATRGPELLPPAPEPDLETETSTELNERPE